MEFVKLQKFGFIRLGNVGGKLAGSLIRNGCDLVLRDIGLFQDIATAHNVPLEIPTISINFFLKMGKLGSAPENDRQILLSG